MSAVEFVRLRVDAQGESHLERGELPLAPADFAPPAPPMEVSSPEPAAGWRLLRLPPRWVGDWHPSPARMWIFCLAGEMEFEASDGAVAQARPGSALLLEDTVGRGHRSRVMGEAPALLAAVRVDAAP